MQNPAPAPRLPIEPDPRPFYRPPRRVGCSGMALVSLVTVAAFLLFFAVLTPRLIDRARGISLPGILGLARPTATTVLAGATALPGPLATTTDATPADATPAVPPTAAPTLAPPTVTREPEYVAIGNSAGDNVSLRAEPRTDGAKLLTLRPRTVLLVVGSDVTTDGKLWRNVRPATDPTTGWVMAQYLVPSGPP